MTELSWVTLPERMAIEETLDAIAELHAAGMRVQRVIVNRMTPAGRAGCRYCSVRRRVESVAAADLVSRLRGNGAHAAVATVADRSSEPVGSAALSRLAAEITRAVPPPARTRTLTKAQRTVMREAERFVRLDMTGGASIVFFAGKGGVGKTTCAAASAIHAADRAPRRQVLLLSTDPAHSLGDVLGAPVRDRAVRVPGAPANLQVRELDARAALDRARREFASSIDALFDRIGGGSGFDASHDRRVMHGLLDLAPPGLDELAAVVEVTSALHSEADQSRWDLLVVDTAPTGHALRLLQMPELLHEWTRALMRIVLKYQPVTGVGALGEQLLMLAKRIAALRAALIDPSVTSFVVVTRAATLPVLETARLLTALKGLSIRPRALIVNAAGGGTCAACRASRTAARRALRSLTQLAGKRLPDAIVHAPAAMPPPAGIEGLRAWRSAWAEPPK
jgi:arsenite-transporting ATPase